MCVEPHRIQKYLQMEETEETKAQMLEAVWHTSGWSVGQCRPDTREMGDISSRGAGEEFFLRSVSRFLEWFFEEIC